MAQIAEHNKEENTLLSLRLDAVLKLYFAREENEEQLKQFLKATTHLTDDDLVTVKIKNPILTKEHVLEKDFIVDIHLTSATGELIIIEMQMQKHDGFTRRMIAYNARQYASQLNRGEDYTKLKESISLIITDFAIFDDTDEYYEHILFRRKNTKIFTKAQQFYILDLTKLPKELTSAKLLWARLFKVETEEELRVLMKESEEMREAGKKLLELSADEDARAIAQARKDSQWALQNMIEATEERSREEGREEEKMEIAKNMLTDGLLPPTISKYTNLSIEKIEKLNKN